MEMEVDPEMQAGSRSSGEISAGEMQVWKKTVFEQRWLHARHVETLRSAMASVYAAILSGSLATLKEKFFSKEANILQVFLMGLSILMILLCIKFADIFEAHTKAADELLPKSLRIFPLFPKKQWDNRLSLRGLFLLFFFLCLAGLVVAFIWSRTGI
jgi:1,4-dihydroxy-2-naphthoate octaprenyltransferase